MHSLEAAAEESVGEAIGSSDMEGTRRFLKFDIKYPVFRRFESYLTGIDGGQRSDKTAREICIDISKYLRYASGPLCPAPDWQHMTDRDQLVGYLEKLKRANVGPEGRLAKLDAFCTALKFLKVVLIPDERDPLYSLATQTEGAMAGWKTSLRKDKRRLRKRRLQELSAQDLSLDEVSALLDADLLWIHFDETCRAAERQETIATSQLDQCTILLAGSLLFKNWQRPGAVCNATRKEFEDSKLLVQDRKPLPAARRKSSHNRIEGGLTVRYGRLLLRSRHSDSA